MGTARPRAYQRAVATDIADVRKLLAIRVVSAPTARSARCLFGA